MPAATVGHRAVMRVVVVGATGNIGTSLLEAFANDGDIGSVLGLARAVPSWTAPKTEFAAVDCVQDDLVPHFRGADAVVHLAGTFQPSHDPIATWRVNVAGSDRVFRAVADAGVKNLVYASSIGAYSPGPGDRRVDESWPTDGWPTAGYPREKAYAERLLDRFEPEHPEIRVVRVRPAFVFNREGALDQWRTFAGRLIPGSLLAPERIPLLPLAAGLRFQAMHVSDAAEAFHLAVTRDVRGAFNVAADPVVDHAFLGELFDAPTVPVPPGLLRASLAAAWHLRLVPTPPHLFDAFLRLPVMDSGRAERELGWAPRYTAKEAVRAWLDGLLGKSG